MNLPVSIDPSYEIPDSTLIIDTDPGIDDLFAILSALGSTRLNVAAITTVGGNVSLHHTTRNALRILALAGRPDVPVYAGAAGPLRPLQTRDASDVHGDDGVLGAPLPEPLKSVQATSAHDFLTSTLRAAPPASVTLACLGPLTNLALLLRHEPALASAFNQVVVMAGAFETYHWTTPKGPVSSGGNVTPYAEFNVWADPEAARIVAESGLNIVWIPLDCTHKTLVEPAWLRALSQLPNAGPMLATLLDRYNDFSRERWGTDGGPLHDPNVLAFLEAPELYALHSATVEVDDSEAATRGQTRFAAHTRPGQGSHLVATAVDSGAFFALVLANLKRLPPSP